MPERFRVGRPGSGPGLAPRLLRQAADSGWAGLGRRLIRGVVYRALDVVFQYLTPLVALLVVIPLALGGAMFALNRTETVSARIWADHPTFTPSFSTDRFSSQNTPAQIESTLVVEMIGTDVFADKVMLAVEPQFEGWSASRRDQAVADLRKNVLVTAIGEHLFSISYSTRRPDYGVRLLRSIIDTYGSSLRELESSEVGVTQTTLQLELDRARVAMNKAVTDAQSYQAAHRLSDQAAGADPNFGTLLAQAKSATDHYLSLQALVDEAQASHSAVVNLQAALFHVVDQPAVLPQRLSRTTPGVKEGLTALAGVAAVEALLVYVVARRDPSIRAAEDVRGALGLKPLGSVPVLSSR